MKFASPPTTSYLYLNTAQKFPPFSSPSRCKCPRFCVLVSDKSGTEKVRFGRIREFPKFENTGSGISGMEKVGFGRELKSRVSSIFRVELYRVETTMGRVRKKSGSGIPGPINSYFFHFLYLLFFALGISFSIFSLL